MMRTYLALVLVAFLATADAHPHPTAIEENCTCEPGAKAFESYHIHVLFYPDEDGHFANNTHNSIYARALRKKFVDHFKVPECDESRSIFNLTDLCVFPVDASPPQKLCLIAMIFLLDFMFFEDNSSSHDD